jgi:hypothetical protein
MDFRVLFLLVGKTTQKDAPLRDSSQAGHEATLDP